MIERVQKEYPNVSVFATTLREVFNANSHNWGAIMLADGKWAVEEPREIQVLDRIGGGDGFVGGMLTFAMPDGIFSTSVFVFPILKSVLQHTGLLLIPVLEYISGEYRPTLKDIGWVILGCLVHIVNCEGIDRLLGFTGDYMFFHSGLPFVIPGVPQFITISVFALMVFILLCFLSDIKGSIAFLKNRKKSAC
jgi:hypothetical protein